MRFTDVYACVKTQRAFFIEMTTNKAIAQSIAMKPLGEQLTSWNRCFIGGFRAGTRRNVNWKKRIRHYVGGKVGAWES